MQGIEPFLIGLVDLVDQPGGHPQRDQQDQQNAGRQNSDKGPGRFVPGLDVFTLLLDHHQNIRGFGDMGIADHDPTVVMVVTF